MDTKLFRNFTVYVNRAEKPITIDDLAVFSQYAAADPSPTTWTSGGFLPITGNPNNEPDYIPEYSIDVQGAALLALIQVNERILPAAVQREKVIERIADIERRDDRKANKKDYAQVRDEVCLELLPKAFIRRTLIPVLFMTSEHGQYVFVFTGSAKRSDDVMLSLSNAFNTASATKRWAPSRLDNIIKKTPGQVLTMMAKGEAVDDEINEQTLHYGNSAVLKGQGKQTIRIKDKDMGAADMQALLTQGYDVSKLGVDFWDENGGGLDPEATVQISDKMIFSGLKVEAVSKERMDSEADSFNMFINNTWIIARTLRDLVNITVVGMGGIVDVSDAEIGSHDGREKINSGISVAAQSIIDDPMQKTVLETPADEDDEL